MADRKDNWVSYQSYKSFVIISRIKPSKKVIIKNYNKLLNFCEKEGEPAPITLVKGDGNGTMKIKLICERGIGTTLFQIIHCIARQSERTLG